MDKNYIKNVEDFANFVSEKQSIYRRGTRAVKLLSVKKDSVLNEYGVYFNKFLNGIMNLYPCFYKMNETTRYPSRVFGYNNLRYLNDEKACHHITLMINDFTDAYRWISEVSEFMSLFVHYIT